MITDKEAAAVIGYLLATDAGDLPGDIEESLGVKLDERTQEELVLFYDDYTADRHNAGDGGG